MKLLKFCLKIDTIVQGLGIMALLIAGLSYLFTFDGEPALFFLMIMLYLGVWQVLSGIIFFTWMKGDEKRGRYLFYCILYFLVIFFFIALLTQGLNIIPLIGEQVGRAFGFSYMICVPLLLAGHYFQITFADMARAHYFKKSFWDLT